MHDIHDVLKALATNPIPLKHQKTRALPGGGRKAFAKWQAYVYHLNTHAPGWEFVPQAPTSGEAWYSIKDNDGNVTGHKKIPTRSVAGVITINGNGGSISRGSIGVVMATETGRGLPDDMAKWIAFKQSCKLFGVTLEEQGKRRQNEHRPAQSRPADNRPAQAGNAAQLNALIDAGNAAGINGGELMRKSRARFKLALSALSSDQLTMLASEFNLNLQVSQ